MFADNLTPVKANEIIMQIFNIKNDSNKWNCYIISDKQGTGTDFPTHPEIEKNGGIKVIITFQPYSYGEFL